MAFSAPKLCALSQSQLLWRLGMGSGPLTSSILPQAQPVWSKACVRHKFGVRCGVRQRESSDSCHLSAWT